jgi:hypothetical protein
MTTPEPAPSIPPLVVEVAVATDVDRAFAIWVERATMWWPPGHTMSGEPAAVVFEPHIGGRIYERDQAGTEHTWGEVLVWSPPERLECLWHLGFSRDEATRVAITFTPSNGDTVVRLEQTGWDALGDAGRARRERTVTGWTEVIGVFRSFVLERNDNESESESDDNEVDT